MINLLDEVESKNVMTMFRNELNIVCTLKIVNHVRPWPAFKLEEGGGVGEHSFLPLERASCRLLLPPLTSARKPIRVSYARKNGVGEIPHNLSVTF